MRRTQWALTVAIVLGIAGCSNHAAQGPTQELPLLTATVEATQPSESSPPSPGAPGPVGVPSEKKPTARQPVKTSVTLGVQRVTKSAVVGAVVIDRDTHETITSENADRQFAAGSLVKLLIGLDALIRHPDDPNVRRRVTTMIKFSDDQIANGFWSVEGGGTIVSRMRERMGLQSTEPPIPVSRWGNTLVTANDMARIYDYILTQATAADRLVIVEAMAAASSSGSDGFKQHFGIPSATEMPWAIKQAWATDSADKKAVHSTGLVGQNWRYVVIVLTEHPRGQTWDAATRSVTAGAQVVLSTLE
jgi:hypothetical protein